MMNTILDIVLLVIIALCTWDGYKRGLIGSMAGILAIVIAVFGGTLLSSAYSGEVIPALKPFVAGYMDSKETKELILDKLGYHGSDKSLNDILAEDSSLRYDYALECMELLGFSEERSEELAQRTVKLADEQRIHITDATVAVLCDTITYVVGLLIAFLMILILLIVLGNIGNMSFRLPNMENLDEIGGALLGLVRGFVYCVLLSWVLSFFGLVIGADTLESTRWPAFSSPLSLSPKG